jgi:PmbA protein
MLGQAQLKSLAHQVLHLARNADQAEVLISASSQALTRFANNQIHQNVTSSGAGLQLRVILDKKIGVASSDRLDKQGLEQLAERALTLAKNQKPDPGFVSLPSPPKSSYPKIHSFSSKTASYTPQARANSISIIVNLAKDNKQSASGAFGIISGETAVTNSLGVWAYDRSTKASLSTIFTGEQGSGYASQISRDVSDISAKKIADLALHKATYGGSPQDLPPGQYPVILEPAALADLLDFYLIYGPNARIYHEDVSYLQGRLGKKVFSPQVNLIDDPLDSQGLPSAFDYEGVPKSPLTLIRRGVIKGIAYDSYYSQKYHQPNTAHALPAPNTWGPIPTHVKLLPGKSSLDDLIRHVDRGLLVTRLWYIRLLHPRELNVTGMTRDGLFLIKNGQLAGRVKNLRFTDSLPSVLKSIIEIGNKSQLVGDQGFPYLLPQVRLSAFNFTSGTQFG